MDWSQKRKILYAVLFGLAVIIIVAYPIYRAANPAPTCFDKKQNGDETGVDCGGSCSRTCLVDVKPLRTVWAKVFPLGGSVYDLAAYIENSNTKSGVKNARYTLRVLDAAGVVLIEKTGSTEIAPGATIVLFEPQVAITGNPDRVEVVFNQDDISQWVKAKMPSTIITTKNQNLKNVDSAPRFDATLVNTDLVKDVNNLTLSAIVYDALRNPIGVSRTYVDTIPQSGTQDIFFTWPNRFSKHTGGGICTTPVDTMLVLDRSGSMNAGGKLAAAKAAASAYVDTAEQADKIGFISFATTASNPIDQMLSSDRDAVKKVINAIAVEKGSLQYTDLGEALRSAVLELQSPRQVPNAKPVIIALTDGVANRPLNPTKKGDKTFPEKYATDVALAARSMGIELYTIGLGKDINAAFLRDRIATDPAHYFNAPVAADLGDAYKKISETVCKQEGFITDIVITQPATFVE